jgi:hypothetical protein
VLYQKPRLLLNSINKCKKDLLLNKPLLNSELQGLVQSLAQIQKIELENCVFKILEEREKHSEKTLAQLYDPDKMLDGLREAHYQLDLAVERCYRSKPFASDEERLEYLFKLYEQMITEEKERSGELNFEPVTQKTKKKKFSRNI